MDILFIGFALFSLFFGAGNLIFPPFLGRTYGSNWLVASIGFILTGVGLASVAVYSMAKKNGDIKEFTKVGGEKLGNLVLLIISVVIGPLGAIPRTAATSGEVMIASGINISYNLFIILFFGLTLIFILTDNKLIDLIGKYLTPLLLVVLFFMIISGIVNPIGNPSISSMTKVHTFTKSVVEGYNTMDALASIVFAPIVIKSLIEKGYENDIRRKTVQVILVAATGLVLVYLSLTYLGATSTQSYTDINSRVQLLIILARSILGSFGKYILAAIIVLACFTTSVGLTSSISDMFTKIFDDKISYNTTAIIVIIISIILSMVGVDGIINLTMPLLTFIYPIVLVMIILNLLNYNLSKSYRKIILGLTGTISLIQSLSMYISMLNPDLGSNFEKLIAWLPLYDYGFPWLVPFIFLFVIGLFNREKSSTLV
ncbi:branched-chain amino acid transport system II carrier protein [Anaerococcus sp. mt242]|uniref:branched-chain amino acid transport system II carrier protein n=1 Tax=Anaerococcus sp. mt242 TaxID=2661917 RepID=UPI001933366A|nr:branched-chain amino acid transport system II carrier protein [Anaerococcus sp. mt242]MBM0047091.1 branched-chain amino acid transport system II carrier protein [Anaerococcus sp. mt242]